MYPDRPAGPFDGGTVCLVNNRESYKCLLSAVVIDYDHLRAQRSDVAYLSCYGYPGDILVRNCGNQNIVIRTGSRADAGLG
jgi:hypothetical protein